MREPEDLQDLQEFLECARDDAVRRAADPCAERSPLLTAFAVAEWNPIQTLGDLLPEDRQVRAFVRRWRRLVDTASPDIYPQCPGTLFATDGDHMKWFIGGQRLRCACTLWDALVRDDVVELYRVLGTDTED